MTLPERADQISPLFKEAMAAHLILMAGGVKSDNIFVAPNCRSPEGADGQLGVIVMEGDEAVFVLTVGPCDMSREQFEVEWPKSVEILKTLSDVEAKALRDSTAIRNYAVLILSKLREKLEARRRH